MIVFIPAFILLGAAVVVIVLQYVPRGTGFAWFASSVLFSIAAWIVTILLRTRSPLLFSGQYWITLGIEDQIPSFQLDIINWPFALLISGLVAGVILVSSFRIGLDSNPEEWASVLTVGALGYLGVISANILTAMLIFASLDLVEIAILVFSSNGNRNVASEAKSIFWRIAGLTLFMAAYGWQISLNGAADDLRTLQSGPVHLLLFASAIRMGIIPITSLVSSPRVTRNGFFVTRNLINFLTISTIILQLPFFPFTPLAKIAILIYLLITASVASIRVSRTKNGESFLPFWQVASGSLILAVFIMGYSSAGIVLSITISVLGVILTLIYPINLFSKILGFLAVLGFSGLPVTPNVSGFVGFGVSRDFPGLFFLIPMVILLFSSISKIWEKKAEEDTKFEQWTLVLSPLGFIFPIISSWLLFLNSISSNAIFQVSIPSLISAFICFVLIVNARLKVFDFSELVKKIKIAFRNFLPSTNLVVEILHDLRKSRIQSPLVSITNLFEGDGGILWSILSLVLIITIIRTLGFTP